MNFNTLDINSSALTAQRVRMDTISSNLANVNTTRKPDGTVGPYLRKQVVFAPILFDAMSSNSVSNNNSYGIKSQGGIQLNPGLAGIDFNNGSQPLLKGGVSIEEGNPSQGVQVVSITEDQEVPTRMVYNPGHPDANAEGYVEMPNINVVSEMVDMISAYKSL